MTNTRLKWSEPISCWLAADTPICPGAHGENGTIEDLDYHDALILTPYHPPTAGPTDSDDDDPEPPEIPRWYF